MQTFEVNSLFGLSVDTADQIVRSHGYVLETTDYIAKRGKAGDDGRIVRAAVDGNVIKAVVCWFTTDITQEKK